MTTDELHKAYPLLKKQVSGLNLPWLEKLVQNTGRDPFKVLISCILSLRTQDKTTAEASERLFKLAGDVESLSGLSILKIEKLIYPVGFYKTKAVRINELCKVLINNFKSRVPDSIDDLLTLKGVGRKTANLVVTLGYKKPGICVDTHVHKISNRWGYVRTATPDKTEFALRGKLPRKYWITINGLLVAFGQGICKPVSPFCSKCTINRYCKKIGVKKSR